MFFTASLPAVCPGVKCGYTVCQPCLRRYILDSVSSAHCMQCKRHFARDELVALTNATFVAKTYTEHRKSLLLSMEKSLLPAAQLELEELYGPDVEGTTAEVQTRLKETRKLRLDLKKQKAELEELIQKETAAVKARQKKEIAELEERHALQMAPLNASARAAREKKHALQRALERRLLGCSVKNLRRRQSHRWGREDQAPRRQFIWKCPAADCRGFLSQKWKCGLCGTCVCSKCGETRGEKADLHECNKESVETMNLVRATTHNCPKCAVPIFKIEGCDQMWCTNCHSAFSWETGRLLDNSHIHNPHYIQWLADHPGANVRDAGDVGCGGIPRLDQRAVKDLVDDKQRSYLLSFVGRLAHHQAVTIPKISLPIDRLQRDLQLRFLNKELDEKGWMRELMKATKRAEFSHCALQVYNMLLNAGSDLIRNINEQSTMIDRKRARLAVEKTAGEIGSLVDYVDRQLCLLLQAYGYKTRRTHSVFAKNHAAPVAEAEEDDEAEEADEAGEP